MTCLDCFLSMILKEQRKTTERPSVRSGLEVKRIPRKWAYVRLIITQQADMYTLCHSRDLI
jgi:hypothetical protein